MFSKILIANRGEIAVRVARACREMGVRTVAVYSTADSESQAVAMADEAVRIGPGHPRRSYLNPVAVLEAARRTGAEAIHPGYGFLAEDPDFAEACEANDVVFIGPPARVLARLGSKTSARALMSDAGLPLLPGSVDAVEDDEAQAVADAIGYPLMVKASAGGGGRGMRILRRPEDVGDGFRRARADARALFGDGRVYLERYLDRARHVEMQVLGDSHGTVVQLGSRDCTVQRRRQKLLEESPAPEFPPGVLARMSADAVRGATAAGYIGAGTVEFLVDPRGNHYFIEINCRIQVEHPVTEMVTDVDLVAEQLRVAAGEPLGFDQDDVTVRGVSIECRLNAEDPESGFVPTPGRIDEFVPAGGPFVRVDTHAHAGYVIPPDYDPLIAKLVVWAPDRAAAVARMQRALREFQISGDGIRTTIPFLQRVLSDPRFRAAAHDTTLVAALLDEGGGLDADHRTGE